MKKIISLIIMTVVLTVSTLAVIPASADEVSPFGQGTHDNIEQTIRSYFNISSGNKIFIGQICPAQENANCVAHFIEVVGYQQAEYVEGSSSLWSISYQAGYMRFLDANGDPMSCTVIRHNVYDRTSSGGGYRDEATTYENVPNYFFLTDEGLQRYNGLAPQEFATVSFNMDNPPDVFTYTISPTNFTLKNGSQGNISVDIQFTQAYKQWLSTANSRGLSIDGRYNVCVWVSSECPTDTNSVLSSMTSSRYTKLNYGTYVYEGGGLSEQLQNEQAGDIISSAGSLYPVRIKAQGVCITSMIDPAVEHNTITIASENIKGFDGHTPVYVCVLGAYSGLMQNENLSQVVQGHVDPMAYITAPDMFNMSYYQTITANGGVNGCYQQYDFNGSTVSMHTYWFPFASAAAAVGDGFQGSCVYTPQTVNGKGYNTYGPVTELTNKSPLLTPENLHDVRMPENQWVKPENFNAWQTEWENTHRYGEQFGLDTQTLKDVLDKEGDFFGFLGSAFKVFPSYVLNIFIAFLVGMLVVCLLKFIL